MFATIYGENAQKRLSDVPSQKIAVSDQGGRKRVARDRKVLTAVLAAADIIVMGKLPAGARVHGWRMAVKTVSGAGTAHLGWSAGPTGVEVGDPDGFEASVDLTAQAISREDAAAPGHDKKFLEDVDIIITGVIASTAAGDISVEVEYSLD